MMTERVSRAVLTVGAGAVLIGAVLLWAPDGPDEDGPPPAPGPVARAATAVNAGAQASPPDLAALVADREKWLRAHPDDDASWAALGTAYVERGLRGGDTAAYPRAEEALKRSLALRPAARGNAAAQLGMGALANARGDFAAARRWGEAVRERDPEHWQAYPVLVEAYAGLGDRTAARGALDRLRELRPGALASSLAARVYRDRGWTEDAAARAYDAVALAATPAEKAACLQRLGDLAREQGEPAEAIASYDAALGLVRGHAPSLAGRARALAALGRTDEAVRDHTAALAALPLPEYALEAGELYESLGLEAKARAAYGAVRERAARERAHGVDVAPVLARYEADHGDPDEAVALLTGEWARGHRSAGTADALGWALYRAGRAREALVYAKRATDQGPGRALFAYHRGRIERALGLDGEARRHIGEALRIDPGFSPLLAPQAREALASLGEPPEVGPETEE